MSTSAIGVVARLEKAFAVQLSEDENRSSPVKSEGRDVGSFPSVDWTAVKVRQYNYFVWKRFW